MIAREDAHRNISLFAVLDPNPRPPLASAGPSQARTQGGRRSIAEHPRTRERGRDISSHYQRGRAERRRCDWPSTEDAAWRSVRRRQSGRGRGERTARGLIESSRHLCSYKPRAKVEFKGHNGKQFNTAKLGMKVPGCGKGKKGEGKKRRNR